MNICICPQFSITHEIQKAPLLQPIQCHGFYSWYGNALLCTTLVYLSYIYTQEDVEPYYDAYRCLSEMFDTSKLKVRYNCAISLCQGQSQLHRMVIYMT